MSKQQARVTMADRILNGELFIGMSLSAENMPTEKQVKEYREASIKFKDNLRQVLKAAPVFEVTNVADYVENIGIEKTAGSVDLIRAPFDGTWMEFKYQKKVAGGDICPVTTGAYIDQFVEVKGRDIIINQRYNIFHEMPENSLDRRKIFIPAGTISVKLDELGSHNSESEMVTDVTGDERLDRFMKFCTGEAMIVCMRALQFMNCKNVTTPEYDQPSNFAKSYERKNKIPLLKHHTININPIGKGTGKSHSGGGGEKSFHICRGHFATYSEERPLFGKLSGTFWMPAHVRGNREVGEVKSNYIVNAPPVAVA